MLSRKELKQVSKDQLKGHWKIPVLATLLLTIIEMVIVFITPDESPSILFMIISLIVGAYISIATCKFFLKFIENPDNSNFGDLKVSFKSVLKSIGVNILIALPIFIMVFVISLIIGVGVFAAFAAESLLALNSVVLISTLILIILAVVISLYFAQVFFILVDDESFGCFESIKISIKLMKGHKWEFLVLQLSFIGWLILGTLPFGIGLLWVMPYMNVTLANYYKELVNENNRLYEK